MIRATHVGTRWVIGFSDALHSLSVSSGMLCTRIQPPAPTDTIMTKIIASNFARTCAKKAMPNTIRKMRPAVDRFSVTIKANEAIAPKAANLLPVDDTSLPLRNDEKMKAR